jgi:hypothetical protein
VAANLNANGCSGVSRAAIEFLVSSLIVADGMKLIVRLFLTIISFEESELWDLGWV